MRITVKNIEKNYDKPVLKQISHVFESGKLYVIKGVSGCGKTTLLNIIGGIEEDFGGEIYIDDMKYESSDSIRDITGYVFQNSLLLSNITVMENLLLIHNDSERVMELCKEFGVEDLKDKYPSQLSGGERQRIAVVRAMLINPMLLIADEPTASLDEENSVNTAEIIAGLKEQGRVVIVATHEHYFDELADEIIYLEYGEIENVVTNNAEANGRTVVGEKSFEAETKCRNMSAVKYCAKRDRKFFKPLTLLPFMLSFMLIMIVSTIQNNFESEYMKLITEHYPTDSFSIFESELNSFTYKDELKIYDYYTFEENGVTAFYLADRKDSVLSIDGMIMYGTFPDKSEEIIVSYEFVRAKFKNETDMENIVGEKYVFMDKEFIISGILYSIDMKISQEGRNEGFSTHYNNDVYYRRHEGSIIYIPYDTIQTLGNKSVKEYSDLVILNASYPDLFEHEEVMKELEIINNGSVNEYYSKVEAAQSALDGMVIILTVVFMVCFVISCIFMSSQIQIELFYRRKELGFLQLFGLPKKRVKELVFSGYIIKLAAAFVIAAAVYILCIGVYFAVTGHFVFMNMLHALVVIAAICLFYCMTVMLTMGKFLKKAVIELIA